MCGGTTMARSRFWFATLILADALILSNGGEIALDPSGANEADVSWTSRPHLRLFSVPVGLGGRTLDVHIQQGDDANDFSGVVPRFCAEHTYLASCTHRERLVAALLPVVRAHWREWLEVRSVEAQRNKDRIPGVRDNHDPCAAQYLGGVRALFCMQLGISGTAYNVAVRDGTSGADVALELQRRHGLGAAFVQVVLSALWQRWFDILGRVERRRGVMFWFYLDTGSGSVVDLPHLPLPLPVPTATSDAATFRLVPRLRQRVRDRDNSTASAENSFMRQTGATDETLRTNMGDGTSLNALHAVRFYRDDIPHVRAAQLTLQLYGDVDHQGGETYRNLLEILLERFYGNVQPVAAAVHNQSGAVADAAAQPLAQTREGRRMERDQARFVLLTVAVGHDAGAYDPSVVTRGFEAAIASKEAYCAVSAHHCTFELSTISSFNASAYGNRWVEASALQHGMYRKPGHNAAFFQKVKAALAVLERHVQPGAGMRAGATAAAVDWVFVSDLDTMVIDPENAASLGMFVPGYHNHSSNGSSSSAQEYPYHIVLADRKRGFPNSGCWMVRNSAYGRSFLRRWVALETVPWLTNDNGALAFVVLATLFEDVSEKAIPDAAERTQLHDRLRDYSAQGSLDYTAYSNAMQQLGSPFGKRTHPHIRFLDGGVGGDDNINSAPDNASGSAQRDRPFCVRWPRGQPTRAVDEATWQHGDFMLHNKWHLNQLVSQIRA